jgi:hypothetical protein
MPKEEASKLVMRAIAVAASKLEPTWAKLAWLTPRTFGIGPRPIRLAHSNKLFTDT